MRRRSGNDVQTARPGTDGIAAFTLKESRNGLGRQTHRALEMDSGFRRNDDVAVVVWAAVVGGTGKMGKLNFQKSGMFGAFRL